jgi:hypothetical protein
MKCSEIQKCLLAADSRGPGGDAGREAARHIANCDRCARFQRDLAEIRDGLQQMPHHQPPEDLVRHTRAACHALLSADQTARIGKIPAVPSDRIPALIWAALAALVLLTASFIVPAMVDLDFDQDLTVRGIIVITWIALNTIMLCFAPILIYRFREKRRDAGRFDHEGNGFLNMDISALNGSVQEREV